MRRGRVDRAALGRRPVSSPAHRRVRGGQMTTSRPPGPDLADVQDDARFGGDDWTARLRGESDPDWTVSPELVESCRSRVLDLVDFMHEPLYRRAAAARMM